MDIVIKGAVKMGPTVIPIGVNMNLVANVYPAGVVTLGTCGLRTGNDIEAYLHLKHDHAGILPDTAEQNSGTIDNEDQYYPDNINAAHSNTTDR